MDISILNMTRRLFPASSALSHRACPVLRPILGLVQRAEMAMLGADSWEMSCFALEVLIQVWWQFVPVCCPTEAGVQEPKADDRWIEVLLTRAPSCFQMAGLPMVMPHHWCDGN